MQYSQQPYEVDANYYYYYYPYFIDKKTEAQKVQVAYPRSQ